MYIMRQHLSEINKLTISKLVHHVSFKTNLVWCWLFNHFASNRQTRSIVKYTEMRIIKTIDSITFYWKVKIKWKYVDVETRFGVTISDISISKSNASFSRIELENGSKSICVKHWFMYIDLNVQKYFSLSSSFYVYVCHQRLLKCIWMHW